MVANLVEVPRLVIPRDSYSSRRCGMVNNGNLPIAIRFSSVHSLPHDSHFYFETQYKSRSIT